MSPIVHTVVVAAAPQSPGVSRISRWARRGAMGALRVYQWSVSGWLGAACRYEPSCSEYALRAVERHGVARGGWLAARRLGRCHPLGGSGYDPVP